MLVQHLFEAPFHIIDPRSGQEVDPQSDLGIMLYRAEHQHFPTPTTAQINKYLADVDVLHKKKYNHDEAINLAFSRIHWH